MNSDGKVAEDLRPPRGSLSSRLLNSSSAVERGRAGLGQPRADVRRGLLRSAARARRRGRPRPGGSSCRPSSSMISWPNCRRRMPPRASSGSAAIRPKMFRLAGSAVHAQQQVGRAQVEEAQRVRLDDLARFISRRSFSAAGGIVDGQDLVAGLGRGQQVADRADAADARGDAGHLARTAGLRRTSRSRGTR